MKKKDASFWSDIKTLDERLKKDPESFCFARLSEIYLKVGLVADALHTARAGVARHPGYLAGQRALGLACNASGLQDEARAILGHVTAAIPEDVDAQKILADLHVTSGDLDSAIRAYATVLEFRPDDKIASTELEALRQAGGTYPPVSRPEAIVAPPVFATIAIEEDEEIIELSDSDVYEEQIEETVAESSEFGSGIAVPSDRHDPLSTLTLAELYEKQGFISKALDIYRSILSDDPANAQLLAKVAELEGGAPEAENVTEDEALTDFEEETEITERVYSAAASGAVESDVLPAVAESSEDEFIFEAPALENTESVSESGVDVPEPISGFDATAFESEQVSDFNADSFEPETISAETFDTVTPDIPVSEESESTVMSDFSVPAMSDMAAHTVEPTAFAPLANQSADNVLETLDSWLENIRRIKACR